MADTLDYRSAPVLQPPKPGVYYDAGDSPSLFVRTLITLLDLIVAVVVGATTFLILRAVLPTDLIASPIGLALVLVPVWCYVIPLKTSRFGTLGYSLLHVRIVTLRNEKPSLLRMTFRGAVAVLLNPLLDLISLSSDDNHQTIRDRLAGTYVVRRSAVPAGQGEIGRSRMFMANLAFAYREVKRGAAPLPVAALSEHSGQRPPDIHL